MSILSRKRRPDHVLAGNFESDATKKLRMAREIAEQINADLATAEEQYRTTALDALLSSTPEAAERVTELSEHISALLVRQRLAVTAIEQAEAAEQARLSEKTLEARKSQIRAVHSHLQRREARLSEIAGLLMQLQEAYIGALSASQSAANALPDRSDSNSMWRLELLSEDALRALVRVEMRRVGIQPGQLSAMVGDVEGVRLLGTNTRQIQPLLDRGEQDTARIKQSCERALGLPAVRTRKAPAMPSVIAAGLSPGVEEASSTSSLPGEPLPEDPKSDGTDGLPMGTPLPSSADVIRL